jgi:ABC-type transport system substrate-binding protein
MRPMRLCVLAVLVVGVAAGNAGAGGDGLGAAPVSTSVAQVSARVPASAAVRSPRRIAVFGLSVPVDGFGPNAQGDGFITAGGESTRGAFIPTGRGVWVKDLVTAARATRTSLSYTISPKAFWYWGGRKVPVTYRDFVYTLQQLAGDPNTGLGAPSLDPTRFTHHGARQVTFFWRTSGCSTNSPCGPTADWQSLFSSIFPSFALQGVDFATMWASCICGADGKPVSDGPFYLASYTPGQEIALKANPYWGGAKPRLAEIDVRFFANPDTLYRALQQGVVDAAPLPPANSPSRAVIESTPGLAVERYVDRPALEQLQLREGDAPGGPSVTRGSSNALLHAPWIRQAIMLALDRQAIIDAADGPDSGAKPADNLLFFPSQSGYRPDFAGWDYNPKKALEILKAHCSRGTGPSAPDPANTKIWRCAGLPAIFRWTWRTDSLVRTTIEQLAKRQLLSIGIALTERPLPATIIYSPSGLPSGDFDIANFAFVSTGDPGDWIPQYTCRSDSNWTGFCSTRVDALLTAASAELDPAKRTADFQAADKLLATTVPVIPLYVPTGGLVHKPDLLGIHGGRNAYLDLETWHWRK